MEQELLELINKYCATREGCIGCCFNVLTIHGVCPECVIDKIKTRLEKEIGEGK
jgi:hypothetical protein